MARKSFKKRLKSCEKKVRAKNKTLPKSKRVNEFSVCRASVKKDSNKVREVL